MTRTKVVWGCILLLATSLIGVARAGGGGAAGETDSRSSGTSLQMIFLIVIITIFGVAVIALISKFIISYCCCPEDYFDSLESQKSEKGDNENTGKDGVDKRQSRPHERMSSRIRQFSQERSASFRRGSSKDGGLKSGPYSKKRRRSMDPTRKKKVTTFDKDVAVAESKTQNDEAASLVQKEPRELRPAPSAPLFSDTESDNEILQKTLGETYREHCLLQQQQQQDLDQCQENEGSLTVLNECTHDDIISWDDRKFGYFNLDTGEAIPPPSYDESNKDLLSQDETIHGDSPSYEADTDSSNNGQSIRGAYAMPSLSNKQGTMQLHNIDREKSKPLKHSKSVPEKSCTNCSEANTHTHVQTDVINVVARSPEMQYVRSVSYAGKEIDHSTAVPRFCQYCASPLIYHESPMAFSNPRYRSHSHSRAMQTESISSDEEFHSVSKTNTTIPSDIDTMQSIHVVTNPLTADPNIPPQLGNLPIGGGARPKRPLLKRQRRRSENSNVPVNPPGGSCELPRRYFRARPISASFQPPIREPYDSPIFPRQSRRVRNNSTSEAPYGSEYVDRVVRQASEPTFRSHASNFSLPEDMLRNAPPAYEESISSHSLYEPD